MIKIIFLKNSTLNSSLPPTFNQVFLSTGDDIAREKRYSGSQISPIDNICQLEISPSIEIECFMFCSHSSNNSY